MVFFVFFHHQRARPRLTVNSTVRHSSYLYYFFPSFLNNLCVIYFYFLLSFFFHEGDEGMFSFIIISNEKLKIQIFVNQFEDFELIFFRV